MSLRRLQLTARFPTQKSSDSLQLQPGVALLGYAIPQSAPWPSSPQAGQAGCSGWGEKTEHPTVPHFESPGSALHLDPRGSQTPALWSGHACCTAHPLLSGCKRKGGLSAAPWETQKGEEKVRNTESSQASPQHLAQDTAPSCSLSPHPGWGCCKMFSAVTVGIKSPETTPLT